MHGGGSGRIIMLKNALFWLVPALLIQAVAGGKASAADRPNILVIMSDEHNVFVTGCYDNETIRTPNLDRLAASGVTFDAAYTNSPLCVPCRLSFTSGKYISRVGAWSNDTWLPSDDIPSIARVMTAAGYDSLLCGKMHYDRTRRYGFTEIGSLRTNQSTKHGLGHRRNPDDLAPKDGGDNARFKQFHAGDDSSVLKHDREVTRMLTDFLASRGKSEKPFFMIAGYLAPHFPLIVPESYWNPYKGKVPMPRIPEGHIASLPLNYRHLRVGFDVLDPDPEIVRRGRELYYGLTQWLDEQIGEVLDALERSGLADNTVVIYTTDHGENMGEHGMWWKNCMFEHSSRVPLIVSWPKRWPGGQRRMQACSLVDVVQTIAELGGAGVPDDWDGKSMVRWLDNADAEWRDLALSEYYGHNIASGFTMLRHGRFKYVYHAPPDERHPAERELYDLWVDPGEFSNLAGRPEFERVIERMHAMMIEEHGEHPDKIEQRCREDYAKGYGRGEAGG